MVWRIYLSRLNQFRCVQFVDYEVVHRAAFELDDDSRRYEVWQDRFEEQYNVKFGNLNAGIYKYTLIFPGDEDYTMFMLRWA